MALARAARRGPDALDYAGAVEKFRQAIDLEPASVPLRFALGSAYSFLDRRLEAIPQFRRVMANSAVGRTEYDESRRWLVRVGALAETAAPVAEVRTVPSEVKNPDTTTQGSITGKTQWPGVTPAGNNLTLRVSILGAADSTRSVQRRADLVMGGQFEFKDVAEGQYRVVGSADEKIVWDQRVTVMDGKQIDLARSPAESSPPGTAFPLARK